MSRPASLIISIASIIAGLFFIGLNLYLRSRTPGISIAYGLLGTLVIGAGLYVAWLYGQNEKLQQDLSNLQQDDDDLRAEIQDRQTKFARLQSDYQALKRRSTYQRRVPRICDSNDTNVLPPVSAEQLYIMQQLFWGAHRIHVKPLEGGYSNLGVYQVIEETADHSLMKPGVVVKFLTFEDIVKEKNVFKSSGVLGEYPLAHTPGRPIKNWPPDHQLSTVKGRLGAVSYELAALQNGSQLHTLKSLYRQLPSEEIIAYAQLLFDKLDRWYALRLPTSIGPSLGGPDGVFERLYRRRRDIQNGIGQLLKAATPNGAPAPSFDELEMLTELELPFLPENWRDYRFHNPIHWINNVLVPGQASCFRATTRYSPVHGDLHTGNVLIEKGSETLIWLIDFPNAHIGPALQDFATLEADVKFNLIDMGQVSLDEWLKFEEQLLVPLRSRYLALDSPWFQSWKPPEGELLKAWEFIGFLRRWVRQRQLIGADVSTYYLALLHTTLPIVYRHSHSHIQKQCALTSAAWMCEHLSS